MSDNKNITLWIERLASWRLFFVLLVLYALVFSFLMRGFGGAHMDTPPLDLLFRYTPDMVQHYLESLGAAGRASRVLVSATLDTAYPLVYSSLFAVLIVLLTRFLGVAGRLWSYLALLPFVILGFDLAENISIIVISLNYPAPMSALAHAASLFTSLKWVFAYMVIGITALLGLAALFRLVFTQRRGA